MLELDQILKANEINFAILAALPAFFLSVVLLMLVRAWFKQVGNFNEFSQGYHWIVCYMMAGAVPYAG